MAADHWGRFVPEHLLGDARKVICNKQYPGLVAVQLCGVHISQVILIHVATAKLQVTLWSEPVLKGVTLMFSEPGHAGKAQKMHMWMRAHKE